ncbi:sulfite exporter TauE/SafE family protein [Marinicrinis lubricantis]|uniref:Probable membrane transporter protein n=1 Tax=Marinicrinis lubricantis TaxID=2086470 RepID=A0ABW1IQ53_9BACL
MDLWVAVMGLAVGFLVGLTGVGGAALLTPVLVIVGVNPSIAVGTDLFYNSITKLFGTIQHYRQKTIQIKVVGYLASGSIPGAIAAIGLLTIFDRFFKNQESLITHALGFMLIVVAVATLYKQFFNRKTEPNRLQQKAIEQKKWLTVGIGFVLGFVVGLTSVGSGSLFALALIYLFTMKGAEVVGTDIAHAFLLVTVAGVLHAGLGHVDFGLAFNLLIGSIPGVWMGSTLSAKLPTRPLRAIVAGLILISGIKLLNP